MTVGHVVNKTSISLAVLLVGAAVGWAYPALMAPGMVIAFVVSMFLIFRHEISPTGVLAYSLFEGLALGGLSSMLEDKFPGIATQAVLATIAVAVVTLLLFKNGTIRATAKATRIVLAIMVGYLVFSILNLILSMTGIITTPWGINGMNIPGTSIPFGLVLGILAICLAAYCLVMDFDEIDRNVNAGAPAKEAWRSAFGLMLTLVWMYTEFLRLFSILRNVEALDL